jgi:hypothetical protein
MTSVIGHLNGLDFIAEHRKWGSCSPESLFEARVVETVDQVWHEVGTFEMELALISVFFFFRRKEQLQRTLLS